MDSVSIMLIPSQEYMDSRPKTKDHHLTVAYFGTASEMTARQIARLRNTVDTIKRFSNGPIPAKANGIGLLGASVDGVAVVDLIDGIGSFQIRAKIENVFGNGMSLDGLSVDYTHGFTPHITREYVKAEDFVYAELHPDMIDGLEFMFTAVGLWHGDQKYEVEL